MKSLLIKWPAIRKRLVNKNVFLFLDYDGTLSPIAKTPDIAKMSQKAQQLLRALSSKPDIKVAIISGRSFDDISGRLGIRDIIYAGNHGMEIKGPGITRRVKLPVSYYHNLKKLKRKLLKDLSRIKGILIEDKGYTLSVHYRLVKSADVMPAIKTINMIVGPLVENGLIKLTRGKKIFELGPPIRWEKGKAVLWILKNIKKAKWKKCGVFPIYIGDDLTDENAFKALKSKGLAVFVGKKKMSQAGCYLKGIKDVMKFLNILERQSVLQNNRVSDRNC